jgi:predicted ABC-type ATPase
LDEFAQILSRFLREALLNSRQRFSFETVFSHASNINFMQRAKMAGYKVYLYFVTTSSPEINKDRVRIRVLQGGHNIPPETIEDRYLRSMKLLYSATKPCYQCFFFDNSSDKAEKVNHFKLEGDHLKFDFGDPSKFPIWFRKYYWNKKFKK